MMEYQSVKHRHHLRNLSPEEPFGYLQRETLRLIALGVLAVSWLGVFAFYDPIDRQIWTTWVPSVGAVWIGCSLALVLNHRHFRLAVAVLSVSLLVADGIALCAFRSGQLLYFSVPAISLANYLVGPLLAGAVSIGTLLLAGLGVSSGVPLPEIIGPLILAVVTVTLNWLSSRYLHMTLQWAWNSYVRSLEKADESQRHRAEMARANRSLEEALHRLNRLNDDLMEAWRVAEEVKAFKSKFAANISHELRTPLYIIVGFSETMLFAPESYGETLPAAYRSDLMEIYNSSRHLLRLTDDVLDLAQIEAGRMGLVKEPADVAEVIQEAVDLIQPLVKRKQLSLQVQIRRPLPLLRIDRTRIRQVLLNLLNNAARYTEQGGITVEAQLSEGQLLISVADTGPGIPAEQMQQIFESFYQVDASISRRYGGAGLGLAISKYFVEMHGGHIQVQSEPGVGSCFRFALPLADSLKERGHSLARLHQNAPMSLAPNGGRQVLAVHPDSMVVQLLERHLEGFQVVHAVDVAAAEGQLAISHPIAIITSRDDVDAVLSLVRNKVQSRELPDIPVLTCPMPTDVRLAFTLGVQGYLAKPVTTRRLLSTLQQCAPEARRVLVVDDDPRVVRLLTRMLQSIPERYHILRAFGGDEALELIQTGEPDVVLLDLYMPEPNGFTILEHMTSDPALAQIRVVVVSAKGLPEDGVLQLNGPVTVTQPSDALTLAQLFRYLQALLSASRPTSLSE
jgi:signal transduction histidine kinase